MSNPPRHDGGFFIPEPYTYAPISNGPIDFQAATNPFQEKNSISARPQPPGSSSRDVVDYLIQTTSEAAQESAKEAAKNICKMEVAGIKTTLEADLKANLEVLRVEILAKIDAEMRERHSTQTKDLNGALSKLPAAIKDEVTKSLKKGDSLGNGKTALWMAERNITVPLIIHDIAFDVDSINQCSSVLQPARRSCYYRSFCNPRAARIPPNFLSPSHSKISRDGVVAPFHRGRIRHSGLTQVSDALRDALASSLLLLDFSAYFAERLNALLVTYPIGCPEMTPPCPCLARLLRIVVGRDPHNTPPNRAAGTDRCDDGGKAADKRIIKNASHSWSRQIPRGTLRALTAPDSTVALGYSAKITCKDKVNHVASRNGNHHSQHVTRVQWCNSYRYLNAVALRD
ncbi:hypothetical protein V502_06616 [Pseudogymnoascus sp. VKM F-4520 (FW-2644)]|nr:hypothetical protein V502_06616 [Pseudogymnoascus sp. VKM F-4520 (FW-2644)]